MLDISAQFLGNPLHAYILFVGILAAGYLVGKMISWTLQNIIKRLAAKTKTKIDDVLVDICHGPLVFAIIIGTLAYAVQFLVLSPGVLKVYDEILRTLIMIDVAWFIIRFLDSMIENYLVPYAAASESDLDDVLIPILHTAVKIVIISIVGVMVLSGFGYDVTSIVAGLGIGGLAFAFAAQDLIKNVFGGVSILTDKPFKMKDMIKFDSRQGTVREIGLRTTRIETLDGTVLVVPNAKFTDGIVENVTKRKQHRVSLTLCLEYGTSAAKLKRAKEILRAIVKRHRGASGECTVFFGNFGASSLEITFVYFVTDLKRIPDVQDEVNMEIKAQFEKAGIGFAFPTQTVILKKR
jgi:MscS family membrane protein